MSIPVGGLSGTSGITGPEVVAGKADVVGVTDKTDVTGPDDVTAVVVTTVVGIGMLLVEGSGGGDLLILRYGTTGVDSVGIGTRPETELVMTSLGMGSELVAEGAQVDHPDGVGMIPPAGSTGVVGLDEKVK